jgi:hypothetical protein
MDKYITIESIDDIIRFYAKPKVAQEKAITSVLSGVL